MRQPPVWSLALALLLGAVPSFAALRRGPRSDAGLLPVGSVSELSWLSGGLTRGKTFGLTPEPWRAFLERYLEPYRNHTPEWRTFYRGAFGPSHHAWLPELCWGAEACTSEVPVTRAAFEPSGGFELRGPEALSLPWALRSVADPTWSLEARPTPAPELVSVAVRRPCPRWKAPRPVTVMRYAGEVEVMTLTDCGGALDSDALDKLSVLARPPGAARPDLPLPLEPLGDTGEWTPQARMLAPRLAWAVSEIARAFPRRAIVLMSGYRTDGHSGHHGKGRALDLYVRGVTNEDLFAVCRTLRDAGCGYYPYNNFIHIDVRPFGTGRVAWVDVSQPGEKSEYLDGWPGVLAAGSAWLGI